MLLRSSVHKKVEALFEDFRPRRERKIDVWVEEGKGSPGDFAFC